MRAHFPTNFSWWQTENSSCEVPTSYSGSAFWGMGKLGHIILTSIENTSAVFSTQVAITVLNQ